MPESFAGDDQRTERRTNLFVVAALHWRGAPLPVRIRNLSPRGALIEGPGLPEIGTSVRLSRGRHSVDGELLWRGGSHAGLQFLAPVQVADWLPASMRNVGQQRVDQIVFEAKAAGIASGIASTGAQGTDPRSPDPRSPDPSSPDYAAIADALTKAGEELVAVPGMAERHPQALQAIDIAAQALALLTRRQ